MSIEDNDEPSAFDDLRDGYDEDANDSEIVEGEFDAIQQDLMQAMRVLRDGGSPSDAAAAIGAAYSRAIDLKEAVVDWMIEVEDIIAEGGEDEDEEEESEDEESEELPPEEDET